VDHLRRWEVYLPDFLDRLAGVGTITGPASEIVPLHLWRLGKATWAGSSREVFLARNLDAENRPVAKEALGHHPKAVLLFPTEAGVQCWAGATTNPTVGLESVLCLRDGRLHFDYAHMEGRLRDAGVAGECKPKRPIPKRGTRATAIESLTRELEEHVRAARDHGEDSLQRTGTPQILRRPTQKELARRCGLSNSAVSRAIKDPTATNLHLLWDLAANRDDQLLEKLKGRSKPKKQ
jgi:hypothetical protein